MRIGRLVDARVRAGSRASSRAASSRLRLSRTERSLVEAFEQHAVPEPSVADDERLAAELLHRRPHDAGAREHDLGSSRLEADDPSALVGGARAVELDLAVDLGSIEGRALDDVRVVRSRVRASRRPGS